MHKLWVWVKGSFNRPERLLVLSLVLFFTFRRKLKNALERRQPMPMEEKNGSSSRRKVRDQGTQRRGAVNDNEEESTGDSQIRFQEKIPSDEGSTPCHQVTIASQEKLQTGCSKSKQGHTSHDWNKPSVSHEAEGGHCSLNVSAGEELHDNKELNPGETTSLLRLKGHAESVLYNSQIPHTTRNISQEGVQPTKEYIIVGDMPPKRKRRTSREESKTKKTKEDCTMSLKNYTLNDELTRPFSLRKCRSWFLQYAGQDDPETIGPEGIEKLCHDLAVDPENIVMLVIAWKLQAETLGFFKFAEWSKGMGILECDSTAKLQARLGSLTSLVRDNITFKKIYRYAFDFCRNCDQRTLDTDTAMAMMKVLLDSRWSLLDQFLEFLQQSKYKVMNRDQWCNVLEFSRSIATDLSNYDEDGAWPVLMDEFVEWYRTNCPNQQTTI